MLIIHSVNKEMNYNGKPSVNKEMNYNGKH